MRRISIPDAPVDPMPSRETLQSRLSSRELRAADEQMLHAYSTRSRGSWQGNHRTSWREMLRPPLMGPRLTELPEIKRKSRHANSKTRQSNRRLPTARVERIALDSVYMEGEVEWPRPPSIMDMMLVLPVGPQPGDDERLPLPGDDQCAPVAGSAAWYLQQIIADDEVFTANSKRDRLLSSGQEAESGPQYFRPSEVEEDPLMKLCYQEASCEAETKADLRDRVLELLLRYMMSSKCCFQVKAFLSADGHHLFLGVYAEELVLRGHADLLGYDVALDETVASGLLRGSFLPGELLPPHVRYNLEEEQQFRRLHNCSPFKSYPGSFAEQSEGDGSGDGASIFRAVDRMRIVEAVISRVFNLEDLLELGFVSARYSCHSVPRQRHLAKTWATPKLLYSPSVPLDEIRNYLGEAMTFRICFLSFLTRTLMPVAGIAAVAGIIPHAVLPTNLVSTLLCAVLALWAAFFRLFWNWTEQYWAMAWGMDGFKSVEATRPRFLGSWGVWPVDRYTIIKVASAPQQFLRRAFTGVVTVLFNALLVASVVALMAYRRSLVVSGHQNRAHLVSYLNAAQMLLLDTVWGYLALTLTDFDNYRRESDYMEKVIWRIFTARFINSFASLFYVALLKHPMEGCEDGYGCHAELKLQLRVMFGTSIARSIMRAGLSYAWFRVSHWLKLWRARPRQGGLVAGYNILGEKVSQSSLEVQASMPEFTLSENVEDSMDMIIEFGFVLYFGSVAPEIVWLFCASNLIRLRAWGWKLLFAVRRPFPFPSTGLGTLNMVVAMMSIGAVWFNIISCLMLNAEGPSQKDIFLQLKHLVADPGEVEREAKGGTLTWADWKLMLLVFLMLERALWLLWWLITLPIPAKWRLVKLAEQRRDAMVKAYYKVLVEGAAAPNKERHSLPEATVEALVPVQKEGAVGSPSVWQPVVVERILRACRQVNLEATQLIVSPWTSRDPGFEAPHDDSDEGEVYTRESQVDRGASTP